MTANVAMGGRKPAVAGRSSLQSETPVTFLSTLDTFFDLLDTNHRGALSQSLAGRASSLLDLRHFRVDRPRAPLPDLMPVCGGTWGQGLAAMVELAARVADWAAHRELDICDERLVCFWNEACGLAWFAELTARVNQLPAPYTSWQAGMLLLAVGLSEQLRLMEMEEYARPRLALGVAANRQIESLVMQHGFMRSLSPSASERSSVSQGPWPCMALAHRIVSRKQPFEWSERFFERSSLLWCHAVTARCLLVQLERVWPEYVELAAVAWRTARTGSSRRA